MNVVIPTRDKYLELHIANATNPYAISILHPLKVLEN